MNKLLIVCGPTATGKTNLAINLAKKFNGEIISADSRQVYQGMDIGTGKNLPRGSQPLLSHLQIGHQQLTNYHFFGSTIWGYDLTDPHSDFGVGQYVQLVQAIIKDIWKRNKLPIIVGGTGLYLKALTQPLSTLNIPPDDKLRHKLNQLNINKLQQLLRTSNPKKLKHMNQSDKNNPRRLIRAIEIANHTQNQPNNQTFQNTINSNQLWIGLSTNLKKLDQLIGQNVKIRATAEFTSEIHKLEKSNFDWSSPAASATGYHQWKKYLDAFISKQDAISLWTKAETQYARRQLTWFNKQLHINWFDIAKDDWVSQVEDLAQDWYS